jgi:hypothetical protein
MPFILRGLFFDDVTKKRKTYVSYVLKNKSKKGSFTEEKLPSKQQECI